MAPSTGGSASPLVAVLNKLSKHWTNIAHHLYLKHDCPTPLPKVGPLAELLNVTRGCCNDINSLAAADAIGPADLAVALQQDSKAIRTLGTLVQWLQAEPQEQLLLSSEAGEALWHLLLVALGNLLRAADRDLAVAARFREPLLASGMLAGLPAALQWLLQAYPGRCLTASAGAWLLLQELVGSSSSSSSSSSDSSSSTGPTSEAAAASTGRELPQLAAVLQGYLDQAYATQQLLGQLPAQPALQAASNSPARHSTPIRKASSRGRDLLSAGGSGAAAAAAAAADEAAASSRAGSDAGGDESTWQFAPPVCLADDPSSALFGRLLALLHSLQARLLVAAAAACSSGDDEQQPAAAGSSTASSSGSGQVALPAKACLQVLALANTWLQQQHHQQKPQDAPAGVPFLPHKQAALLDERAALATLQQLGVSSTAQALQLVAAACKALQAARSSSSNPANGAGSNLEQPSGSSNNPAAATTGSSTADPVLAFELLLQSVVLLQQQRGREQEVPAVLLQQLAEAARACSKQQLEQLVASRGQLLLRALSDYLQQEPPQEPQKQQRPPAVAAQQPGDESSQQQQPEALGSRVSDASSAGGDSCEALEPDAVAGERCVLCAQVLMGMCPGRLMGMVHGIGSHDEDEDDRMLGSLTERDPPRFYAIMDFLVRHVQPQNLLVLLPMAAAFLAHSTGGSSSGASNGGGEPADPIAAAEAAEAAEAAGGAGGRKKSLVLLADCAVCRSFAAALHGYSKSVVAPVAAAVGQQQAVAAAAPAAAAANGGSNDGSNGPGGEQREAGPGGLPLSSSVYFVLPPVRKVSEWLVGALDDAITAAMAAHRQGLGDTAGSSSIISSGSGQVTSKPQEGVPPSPDALVEAVRAATRASACSLALVVLIARAAMPVLRALELQLQRLQPVATQPEGQQQAVVANELLVLDLISGLLFVRAAVQALLARTYLSQVVARMPEGLAKMASEASGSDASTSATGSSGQRQIRDVMQQALVIALRSTQSLLAGQGLARGWAHLAGPLPPPVLALVRGFQGRWPGDFLMTIDVMNQLTPVAVAATRKQPAAGESVGSGAAAAAGEGDDDGQAAAEDGDGAGGSADAAAAERGGHALYALPRATQQQLLQLMGDLQELLGCLLDEVPLPVGCNNPGCSNLAGMAEASLGCNKRCSQCMCSHYCSKSCQTAHWPVHKLACKRVRQL